MHVDALSTVEPFVDPIGEAAELIAAGRAREVIGRAEALLAADRGGLLTRVALGRALVADGQVERGVEILHEASLIAPNVPEILLALGEAFLVSNNLPGAIGEFQRVARLAPDDPRPRWRIAQLWLEAGEPDKAEAEADVAAGLGADAGEIATLRARAHEIRGATRADAGYVRHLFDQFAADYDVRMRGRLGYAAPGILRDLAGMLLDPTRRDFAVLDLGCGTGLSGVAFKPIAKRLVGVDLSPRMLAKARQLKIYDALIEGDVERPAVEGVFDIVIAADVLVYLGDLDAVFAVAHERLTADGLWLFTTERGDGIDFELGPKRRYRHSADYLRTLADKHGFDVASLIESVTRYEAGEGVQSWAAALRRR
jgi:predicted TPR repeat methyltransferase